MNHYRNWQLLYERCYIVAEIYQEMVLILKMANADRRKIRRYRLKAKKFRRQARAMQLIGEPRFSAPPKPKDPSPDC